MSIDHGFFLGLSQTLFDAGQAGEIPGRYLLLERRRQVLRRYARRVRRAGRRDNPLARIELAPPLNVSGAGSLTIVRAEGLRLRGIPVETEPGAGTPLENVRGQLWVEGCNLSNEDMLHHYARLMAWTVLGKHPKRRFAKIPRLIQAIRDERAALEGRLREYVRQFDPRTFSVAVAGESLAAALRQVDSPSTLLGYAGQGILRVQGKHDVPVGWGQGRGLASVATNDLRSLVEGSGSKMACIDCDLNGWDAWCDRLETLVQTTLIDLKPPPSKRFEYYRCG